MNNKIQLAIIGGTGVNRLFSWEEKINTPYGSVRLKIGEYRGKQFAFLNRHEDGHKLPPHLVNYRANIGALKEMGVKNILAVNACGAINRRIKPGDFIFVDQFLDFTKSRANTFFNGENGVRHIDLTDPYCPKLRKQLIKAAKELALPFQAQGTLVITEGPRFETPAEINFFSRIGGDLVNMTGYPEVVLAREAGICYASICIVSNFAAGVKKQALNIEELGQAMAKIEKPLWQLIFKAVEGLEAEGACSC